MADWNHESEEDRAAGDRLFEMLRAFNQRDEDQVGMDAPEYDPGGPRRAFIAIREAVRSLVLAGNDGALHYARELALASENGEERDFRDALSECVAVRDLFGRHAFRLIRNSRRRRCS